MDLRVVDDPATACAELLAAAAERGEHIALTGGSTPRIAYERATALADDWSRATLWWGDERCVPPDDELSNYGMAKAALLDRVAGPAAPTVRRIPGERGPAVAADDYERELRQVLGEQIPRLDLILLGLGPDAHVASLFPRSAELRVRDRAVVGVEQAAHEPYVPRVSLTMPVLSNGRSIVFLVAGAAKADAVARAFGAEQPSEAAPGSLVRPVDGSLTVLLDRPAASALERSS